MKRLLAAMLLVPHPAAARQPPKPNWDCAVELHQGSDNWDADGFGVRWHRFTASKAYIAVSVWTHDVPMRESFRRHGAFDPALRTHVTVAPPTTFAKKPLWVSITAGSQSLDPLPVRKSKGFYSGAAILLMQLEPLLAKAERLEVKFHFADGTVLDHSTIAVAELRSAIDRLPQLADQYDARMVRPEGICVDRNDDILIVD